MKFLKIKEFNTRILKIIEIIECQISIMTMIQIIKFQSRITKIMKRIEFQVNYENHENLRIRLDNKEKTYKSNN